MDKQWILKQWIKWSKNLSRNQVGIRPNWWTRGKNVANGRLETNEWDNAKRKENICQTVARLLLLFSWIGRTSLHHTWYTYKFSMPSILHFQILFVNKALCLSLTLFSYLAHEITIRLQICWFGDLFVHHITIKHNTNDTTEYRIIKLKNDQFDVRYTFAIFKKNIYKIQYTTHKVQKTSKNTYNKRQINGTDNKRYC